MRKTLFATGASSGIGRATVLLFNDRGWNVVATMRSPEKETELTTLPNVLVTRADVTDDRSITAAVKKGIDHFGRIDVLVNNAGYGAYGPLEATPLDNVRKEFETNVIGTIATIKAVTPHFRQRRTGTIVNISSIGGRVAFPLGSLYHGSKFAVEGVTEALQFEMEAIGVTVKLVEPGQTRTNFAGRSFEFNNYDRLTEYQDVVAKTNAAFAQLVKDAAEPKAVAETIYRAATDGTRQLRYVSGRDADDLLQLRKREDDNAFTRHVRKLFGLEATELVAEAQDHG